MNWIRVLISSARISTHRLILVVYERKTYCDGMPASQSSIASDSSPSGELDVKSAGQLKAMSSKDNNFLDKKKDRFSVIESPFTTAVRDDVAVRGVYSLVLGILSYHLVSMSFKYFYVEDLFQNDVTFLKKAFCHFHWSLISEAAMLATFLLLLLPAVRLRIMNQIQPFLYSCIIIAAFLVLAIVPLYIRYAMDLNVVAAIAVVCEQIRYLMKFISFVVENEKMDYASQPPTIKSSLYFNLCSDTHLPAFLSDDRFQGLEEHFMLVSGNTRSLVVNADSTQSWISGCVQGCGHSAIDCRRLVRHLQSISFAGISCRYQHRVRMPALLAKHLGRAAVFW